MMIKIDDWEVWKVLMMLISFLKMNLNRKIEKIEKKERGLGRYKISQRKYDFLIHHYKF